jgi:DNA-binding beta-propeller fold protein YncE
MLKSHGFFADQKFIRKIITIVWPIVIFSVVIVWGSMISGCQTTVQGPSVSLSGHMLDDEQKKVEGGGWVSLFMNLKQTGGAKVIFTLTSVEIGSGDNWFRLRQSPIIIDASQIEGKQIFIARNGLPQGQYDKLRFTIEKPLVIQDSAEKSLIPAQSTFVMDLPAGLDLSKDDSHSLFVTWDVAKSLQGPDIFEPFMNAYLQAIPLIKDLIFVACPEINTIYVIRTDKNWVISSLGVTGRPVYLEVDANRNQLYVLAAAENFIKVIDLTAFKVLDKYYIAMDYNIDYMFADAEIRYAYLLDEKGKGIAKVDLLDGTLLGKEVLNFYPRYGINLEGQGKLAISASDRNEIYFLSPDTLLSTGSISVDNEPQGILGFNAVLFVAEGGSHTITAYNTRDGREVNKVQVGYFPMRLFLKGNQLYATNFESGSVTVMLPRQLIVSSEVSVGGKPLEIEGSQSRRWLYVGDMQKGGLSVIDSTSNRINQFIDLHAQPMGMAVVD